MDGSGRAQYAPVSMPSVAQTSIPRSRILDVISRTRSNCPFPTCTAIAKVEGRQERNDVHHALTWCSAWSTAAA